MTVINKIEDLKKRYKTYLNENSKQDTTIIKDTLSEMNKSCDAMSDMRTDINILKYILKDTNSCITCARILNACNALHKKLKRLGY